MYWLVDNGSSHNGQRSIDRNETATPFDWRFTTSDLHAMFHHVDTPGNDADEILAA